jgi:hypothetical protein
MESEGPETLRTFVLEEKELLDLVSRVTSTESIEDEVFGCVYGCAVCDLRRAVWCAVCALRFLMNDCA